MRTKVCTKLRITQSFEQCSKQSKIDNVKTKVKGQANAESKAIPRIKLLVKAMSNNENEASNNEPRIIDNRENNKQFQETALI